MMWLDQEEKENEEEKDEKKKSKRVEAAAHWHNMFSPSSNPSCFVINM